MAKGPITGPSRVHSLSMATDDQNISSDEVLLLEKDYLSTQTCTESIVSSLLETGKGKLRWTGKFGILKQFIDGVLHITAK